MVNCPDTFVVPISVLTPLNKIIIFFPFKHFMKMLRFPKFFTPILVVRRPQRHSNFSKHSFLPISFVLRNFAEKF